MKDSRMLLQTLKDTDNWCAVDTESSGGSKKDQVIEIAVSDKYENIVYHELVKPSVPINPYARKVHGISDQELSDKDRWTQAYKRFEKAIKPFDTLIFYNSSFDNRIIKQSYDAYDIPQKPYNSMCYYRLIEKLIKNEMTRGQLGGASLKLETVANMIGIKTSGMSLHTAADDSILLAKVINEFTLEAYFGDRCDYEKLAAFP